jgi:TonB family protein
LEKPRVSWDRWLLSLTIHFICLAAIVAIPVSLQHSMQPAKAPLDVTLIAPPVAKPPIVAKTVINRLRIPEPKLTIPLPVIVPDEPVDEPAPLVVRRAAVLPDRRPVPQKKQADVAKLEAPKLDLPLNPTAAVLPDSHLAPAPPVKVGSFGDPNGVPPSVAPSARPSIVARVGDFESTLRPTNGGAEKTVRGVATGGFGAVPTGEATGNNSVRSPVRIAGFGTAAGGTAAGTNRGPAHSAGFDASPAAALKPQPTGLSPSVETPVEITFKPKPDYTPEAREKKLEGEVQLEVLFSASGNVQILRLLRGLGSGLDESARSAAGQIRFRPGTRDGKPVDMVGTIHIVFQIS